MKMNGKRVTSRVNLSLIDERKRCRTAAAALDLHYGGHTQRRKGHSLEQASRAAKMSTSSSIAASPLADPALGSTIFARLHPATYLARFLDKSIRPDGRALEHFRQVRVGGSTIGTAQGSAIVRHGNTVIVAGVRAEFLETADEEPPGDDEDQVAELGTSGATVDLSGLGPIDRRRLVVGIDLTPMSSARFKPGPPGDEAQVLASRLMQSLDACPPLAASSLEIEKGALSWCLYVDLVCISYDGNLLDASLLAINAALQDAQLPQARYDESTGLAVCSSDLSLSQPLALKACPLGFTFGIVDDTHLLSDPNSFESTMVTAWITVTLNVVDLGSYIDLVGVHCSGRCSATITADEASKAKVKGRPVDNTGDHDDLVRVVDEELINVCLARARTQCALLKVTLVNGQRADKNGGASGT